MQSFFTLLLAWLCLLGVTQLRAQQALLSAGGSAVSDEGTVHYSVGQVAFNYQTDPDQSLTAGVQQVFTVELVDVETITRLVDLRVFPNPTASELQLENRDSRVPSLQLQLVNTSGQVLLQHNWSAQLTTISLRDFPNGSYYLLVQDEDQNTQSFQIIKN